MHLHDQRTHWSFSNISRQEVPCSFEASFTQSGHTGIQARCRDMVVILRADVRRITIYEVLMSSKLSLACMVFGRLT